MLKPGPASALAPGRTIGILGGGQLGRMLALAAARLGLRAHIYSDDPASPAFDVTGRATHGGYTDLPHLETFAGEVDVVTYEFENVPVDAAEFLAKRVPVHPPPKALAVSQDRLVEKKFVADLGIPVAPFAEVSHRRDLIAALERFAGPAILKTRRLGYDGKGQVRLKPGDDAAEALARVGHRPSILEGHVAFGAEVSVIVVRGTDGALAFYDCPTNTHENGILARSVVPSSLTAAEVRRAHEIAEAIARALDYVGVLAVEMFHVGGPDPLVVNEIAPRVHNSGHWTIDGCATSQFENHIRAVAGWPLGSAARHSDVVMTNIIGAEADAWHTRAAEPGLCLHLYGKGEARPGRKMGHATRLLPLTAGRP